MRIWFYPDTNIFRQLVEKGNVDDIESLKGSPNVFKVTPTTIMELVEDLLRCRSHNFGQRRQALELVRQVAGKRVLPASGEFLAKRVFKSSFANPHLKPAKIARWLEVVVRYPSQEQLGSAVKMRNFMSRLDVSYIAKVLRQVRSAHLSMMNKYRDAIEKAPQSYKGGPSNRPTSLATLISSKKGGCPQTVLPSVSAKSFSNLVEAVEDFAKSATPPQFSMVMVSCPPVI